MEIAVLVISLLMMVSGFAGVILPFLPDMLLIFAGALTYALFNGFSVITPTVLLVIAGLTIFSFLVDIISSTLGAKTQQASKYGQFGAVIGAVIGIFTSGFLGIILGPVLGVILFEMIFAKKKFDRAFQAGLGSLVGFIFGSLLKLIIAGFTIAWFVKLVLF